MTVHCLLGFKENIVLRQIHGISAGSASRNNCNFVNRQMIRKRPCHNCVACLVICCKLLLFVGNHFRFLGRSHLNLTDGFLNFFHSDKSAVSAGCNKCSLIEYVFKVSRCAAHSSSGKHRWCNILCQRLVLGVNLDYCFSALNIRKSDYHLTVKSARSQKRRIQNIRSVGSCQNNDA